MTYPKLSMILPLLVLVACGGGDGADDHDDDPVHDTDATGDDDDTTAGDDDDDTTGGADTVEVTIEAAAGGTVTAGDATLAIPPGALAADTTITVTSGVADPALPEADTVAGLVFDFGPDGTTFATPAALTLPLVGSPATGEIAVVSWLDEVAGAWVDLPTTAGATTATAEIEHFTRFAVRFVDSTLASACEEPFVACGGDPTGLWTVDTVCFDFDPFYGGCPAATYVFDIVASGQIEFLADTTFTVDMSITGEIQGTVPVDCVGYPASCSDLNDPYEGSVCTGDPAVACDCTLPVDDPRQDMGQWMVNGTDLVLNTPDGMRVRPFCVNGNQLGVYDPDEDVVWHATK